MHMVVLDRNGNPCVIQVRDVLLMMTMKHGPEFVTGEGSYRLPITAAQLLQAFESYGFEQVDRNVIANLNKAVSFDPMARKLYYDEEGANRGGLYATVSGANSYKVSHLIRESESEKQDYYAAAKSGESRGCCSWSEMSLPA
ncbi:LytTR family transcriptional regulator DNA-binding domain-containing protein [Paenibacillus mendelii]|uniref:LytTR family transcriptional regulator DNA-binding domain-containing protein n=1 Tax=Paenibacillus mendelii TaxID=206163 RepID=A0ABV6JBX1_9BACL|nr:LytTR family transcriptional regulator DNA-binding domain-containing protein [Paenibacillus mendelii]MCQ6558638.1 LytTR family transcriptional regulator DNA-binding domain-containing protein [Paenibacillus mendelii]